MRAFASASLAAVTWATVLVATVLVATADAQQKDESTADSAEARRLFDESLPYIEAGRYPEAVSRLERSLSLRPHPATAYNLVVALLGSGDALRARAILDDLAAQRFGEVPGERAAALAELRQDAEAQIANVRLRVVGPPKAEVRIDGSPAHTITSGERLSVAANPGNRRVVVSARDYTTVTRSVFLEPGSTTSLELELKLAEDTRPSRVVLEADDPEATIEVVGVGRETGRFAHELAPGEYRVRVWLDDEVTETAIEVPPGRRLRITVAAPQAGTVWTSPWFWSAAGVVALAGVAALVFFATRPDDPVEVDPWGTFQALEATGADR